MSHAARASIDLSALRHNLEQVRLNAPNSRVLAVIKANGYGHDVVRVARALNDAEAFGVACQEEALLLRQAGVRHPILLLQGFNDAEELAVISTHDLDTVVHDRRQIELLEQVQLNKPVTVWLKIDTGMNRLGIPVAEAAEAFQRLNNRPNVAQVRLMSHFATADDRADGRCEAQLTRFLDTTEGLEAERSLANSGGVLGWPAGHLDWVRPGLMLYGASPLEGSVGADHGLRPVMNLTTALVATKPVAKGDYVGYGSAWTAPRDMVLGIASIGYGDGYPRHAPPGTPVLVNGRRAPLVGCVSMDMIAVDLSDQPGAAIGDPVVAWGADLPVEEIARCAATIPYELLCQVTRRVRQVTV